MLIHYCLPSSCNQSLPMGPALLPSHFQELPLWKHYTWRHCPPEPMIIIFHYPHLEKPIFIHGGLQIVRWWLHHTSGCVRILSFYSTAGFLTMHSNFNLHQSPLARCFYSLIVHILTKYGVSSFYLMVSHPVFYSHFSKTVQSLFFSSQELSIERDF